MDLADSTPPERVDLAMENFRFKVFRIVAQHLNFSRATEELSLSQPAVTQKIKTLEEECGIPWFDRSGGRITLTPAGNTLLSFANKLKTTMELDSTEALLGAVEAGLGCHLRVALGRT